MIPKGMAWEAANAKLQECAKLARESFHGVVHDGNQVDGVMKKFWQAFCSGGQEAMDKAKSDIFRAKTDLEKATVAAAKLMADASAPKG